MSVLLTAWSNRAPTHHGTLQGVPTHPHYSSVLLCHLHGFQMPAVDTKGVCASWSHHSIPRAPLLPTCTFRTPGSRKSPPPYAAGLSCACQGCHFGLHVCLLFPHFLTFCLKLIIFLSHFGVWANTGLCQMNTERS